MDKKEKILDYIKNNSGSGRKEISKATGIKENMINVYIKKLKKEGHNIICKRGNTKDSGYYLNQKVEIKKTKDTELSKIIKVVRYLRKESERKTLKEISEALGYSFMSVRNYLKTIKALDIGITSKVGRPEISGYFIEKLITEEEKEELNKLDKTFRNKLKDLLERVI